MSQALGQSSILQEQLQERSELHNKHLVHLLSVLQIPALSSKCMALKRNMGYFNAQDLHQFLPHLLSNIFGFDQTSGWDLRYLTSSDPDFELVYSFLRPGGDTFDLLRKLEDKDFSFEFPMGCLPYSAEGHEASSHFQLSAMEYYFYHFFYYGIRCQSQASGMNPNVQDSLYIHLFETYLNMYLPFWGVIPLSPRFIRLKEDHMKVGYKHTDIARSSLLSVGKSGHCEVSVGTPSERFVEILMQFWIKEFVQTDDILNVSQSSLNPTSETLLLLRRLMKHIHYFANGVTVTSDISSQIGEEVRITEALRRSILSASLRRRLFQYLQSCLKCCTGDTSYRYIVELWLTYIQPWRYTDPTQPASDKGEQCEKLSPTWKDFILDNFPFYSTLLMDFLGRCQNFEFTAHVHVVLLYRVSKVFSQTDLSAIMKLGEALLLNICSNVVHKESFMTTPHSIKASFVECYGPEFIYLPIFHERSLQEIHKLVLKVSKSRDLVQSQQKEFANSPASLNRNTAASPDNERSHGTDVYEAGVKGPYVLSRSMLNRVAGYFSADESGFQRIDGENEAKITQMLDATITNLLHIYQIPDPVTFWTEHESPEYYDGDVTSSVSWSEEKDTKDAMLLHHSKLKIEYRGNPLLQPLRSYENPGLTRLLFSASSRLNTTFSSQLNSIGSSNSAVCKGLKLLLYNPHNSLHPRINFRPFASYYNILLIFLVFLFSVFSLPHFITIFLLLFTCLYVMKHST